jgi:RnfABCDGE-type electron transport complex B subunit
MNAVIVLAIMGIVFGVILGLAGKFLQVEIDERVKSIYDMLPHFDCGACGHPGCMGLAEAIVAGEGRVKDCLPLKPDGKEKLQEYLETAVGPDGEKFDLKKVM